MQGTKLACGEGGCGACAVEVTRYDASLGKCLWDPAELGSLPMGAMLREALAVISINSSCKHAESACFHDPNACAEDVEHA